MTDNENPRCALKVGGKYLVEALEGKTDMASLTLDEWSTFVGKIIGTYRAQLQELADDGIPF